jgi:hypothetical protein
VAVSGRRFELKDGGAKLGANMPEGGSSRPGDFAFYPSAEVNVGDDAFSSEIFGVFRAFKTPFGTFHIKLEAGGKLGELRDLLTELYDEGMSVPRIEKLSALIDTLPEVKAVVEKTPHLKELLEGAKIVLALAAMGPEKILQMLREASADAEKGMRARKPLTLEQARGSMSMN